MTTNKKTRSKVARLLRKELGLTWDESHKVARYVVADYDVNLDNVDYVVDCAVLSDACHHLNVVGKYLKDTDTCNEYAYTDDNGLSLYGCGRYDLVYYAKNGNVYQVTREY